jgi:sodium/hydrogen exchanger-like protein 6/7/sodium/hydrogen exchanger 8
MTKENILSLSLMVQYSATICATDSVAALTMIKSDKYPKLFSIIFGEGMVNDAVAIILFKVVGPIV